GTRRLGKTRKPERRVCPLLSRYWLPNYTRTRKKRQPRTAGKVARVDPPQGADSNVQCQQGALSCPDRRLTGFVGMHADAGEQFRKCSNPGSGSPQFQAGGGLPGSDSGARPGPQKAGGEEHATGEATGGTPDDHARARRVETARQRAFQRTG